MANLSIEVITENASEVDKERDLGWGEEAVNTKVSGNVQEITIVKDGESQVSFRILDDGSIIICSYKFGYNISLPRNLTLNNNDPWEKNK